MTENRVPAGPTSPGGSASPRVPAGVPTGGQFAASTRAEADGVALTAPDTDMHRISEVLRVLAEVRRPAEALAITIDDVSLAAEVRRDFPEAATVWVEPYDDGNGSDAYLYIKDADGNSLDDRIASFRPERLDPSDTAPEDGYEIDVQAVLDIDLDAEIDKMRAALTPAAPAAEAPNATAEVERQERISRAQEYGARNGMSTSACSHCGTQTPHFYEPGKMTCAACWN